MRDWAAKHENGVFFFTTISITAATVTRLLHCVGIDEVQDLKDGE